MHPDAEFTNDRLGRIVEDASSEAFIFSGRDFRFRLVNRGARDNLGYTIDELRYLTPWDIKPHISEAQFLDMVQPLLTGEVPRLFYETVHRRKNGTTYEVDVSLQFFADDPAPVFYASIRDISIHTQVEEALREATSRLESILSNTNMSIFVMNDRNQCIFMNDSAEQLTGYMSIGVQKGPPIGVQ